MFTELQRAMNIMLSMPPCHCGKYSACGVGFNKAPLYLCVRHLRAFYNARDKWLARHYPPANHSKCAELDLCARILVALGNAVTLPMQPVIWMRTCCPALRVFGSIINGLYG